jgi:transposase
VHAAPPCQGVPELPAPHRPSREAPRDIHLVLDNYATHKTPEVQAWLEKHPRFKLHFTPTSASWLNLVERFFAEITSKRIRRGSYASVDDLEDAIYDYLLQHNAKPKPFVWSKTAEDILARERRALDALDEIRGNQVANVGLGTLGWRGLTTAWQQHALRDGRVLRKY